MKAVGARFEDGVLKPDEPLALQPGERVRILVLRRSDAARWNLGRLTRQLREDRTLAEAGLAAWVSALEAEDASATNDDVGKMP